MRSGLGLCHADESTRTKQLSMAATISYPESSGFLVSRWAPVETLGNSKKFQFFDWLPCNDFHCFTAEISTGAHPLAKKARGLWVRDCGCHCQGDMAVRMRKVLQTVGLVFWLLFSWNTRLSNLETVRLFLYMYVGCTEHNIFVYTTNHQSVI